MTDVDAVVARCYTRYLFVSLALYIFDIVMGHWSCNIYAK